MTCTDLVPKTTFHGDFIISCCTFWFIFYPVPVHASLYWCNWKDYVWDRCAQPKWMSLQHPSSVAPRDSSVVSSLVTAMMVAKEKPKSRLKDSRNHLHVFIQPQLQTNIHLFFAALPGKRMNVWLSHHLCLSFSSLKPGFRTPNHTTRCRNTWLSNRRAQTVSYWGLDLRFLWCGHCRHCLHIESSGLAFIQCINSILSFFIKQLINWCYSKFSFNENLD